MVITKTMQLDYIWLVIGRSHDHDIIKYQILFLLVYKKLNIQLLKTVIKYIGIE